MKTSLNHATNSAAICSGNADIRSQPRRLVASERYESSASNRAFAQDPHFVNSTTIRQDAGVTHQDIHYNSHNKLFQ